MRTLTEKDAEAFLEKEKFPVVEREVAKTREMAIKKAKERGFPVVLKLSSAKLLHKTEVNAVKVDIRNEQELQDALKKMPKIRKAEFLMQKFVKGQELLIGLKKDISFGHVLLFGLGGIYTETLGDVSMRILPVERKELEGMIKETKAFKILTARNKRINMTALLDVLEKTAHLAKKFPKIEELDINPLVINEKGCSVVDARIVFT